MDPVVLRLLLVAGLLVAVAAVGRWWRSRNGVIRDGAGARLADDHLAALGLDLSGAQAGAVLLGSPTCAPCTTVKRVLTEVAADRDGFRWVYADAADHLEVVEFHRVMRVPTLLIVGDDGRILARTSGVPQADDLRRVLDHGSHLDDVAA
jgi:thiol-disulfide isomerase/thioredoxin